jgi:hypothetical protein
MFPPVAPPLQMTGAALEAKEIAMRLMPIHAASRMRVRFVSASIVRITLSAALTTPQPVVALQAVSDTLAQQPAAVVLSAGHAEGGDASREKEAPRGSDVAGPGTGWG